MQIRLNVKPRIITGYSKHQVLQKAGLCGWRIDDNGSRYASGDFKNVSIKTINLEKRNRKTKVLKSGNRKVIRVMHWIGYVYDFTKYKGLLEVTQGSRNFKIKVK